MSLNTHLAFDGQCETAFRFYERALDAQLTFLIKYGESPMSSEVPSGFGDKVLHATLTLGAQRLTGADQPSNQYETPRGFALTLNPSDPAEADRLFAALSENAQVTLPIRETFWALRFGMLTDQFGIPWMINCEKAAE